MSLYAAPVVVDSVATDVSVGNLLGDNSQYVAIASGRFVRFYMKTETGGLVEAYSLPVMETVAAVRFSRIETDNTAECLIVLSSDKRVFKVIRDNAKNCLEFEHLFNLSSYPFLPTPKLFDVSRQSGTIVVVTSPMSISILNHRKANFINSYEVNTNNINHLLMVNDISFGFIESKANKDVFHHVFLKTQNETESLDNAVESLSLESVHSEKMEIDEPADNNSPILSHITKTMAGDYSTITVYHENGRVVGVGIFGKSCFAFYKVDRQSMSFVTTDAPYGFVTAAASCGNNRMVITTASGSAFLVHLTQKIEHDMTNFGSVCLGSGVVANCICFLEPTLFLGSSVADSGVYVLIDTQNVPGGKKLMAKQLIENFGPINDVCTYKSTDDISNPMSVISVSGTGKDTTIRVIREAVGVNRVLFITQGPAENLFTLKMKTRADSYVLKSSISGSELFFLSAEGFARVPSTKVSNLPTLAADDFEFCDGWIQITPSFARLSIFNGQVYEIFDTIFDEQVCIASVNSSANRILVASAHQITLFAVVQDMRSKWKLRKLHEKRVDSKIESATLAASANGYVYFLIGVASKSQIEICNTVNLEERFTVQLPINCTPFSIHATENILLVSTNHGVFNFDGFSLSRRLAGTPVKIERFVERYRFCVVKSENPGVLAVSDTGNGFLVEKRQSFLEFSSVNAYAACGFAGKTYQKHIVLCDQSGVHLVTLKHRFQKVKCGETVLKMATQRSSNTVAIVTSRIEAKKATLDPFETSRVPPISLRIESKQKVSVKRESGRVLGLDQDVDFGETKENAAVVVLSDDSFSPICGLEFGPFEYCTCLVSGFFEDTKYPHYVVTSGLKYLKDKSPLSTVFIFQIGDNQVRNLQKYEIKIGGTAHSLYFQSGQLVAGIGNFYYTFSLDDSGILVASEPTLINDSFRQTIGTPLENLASFSSSSLEIVTRSENEEVVRVKKTLQKIIDAGHSSSRVSIFGVKDTKSVLAVYTDDDVDEEKESSESTSNTRFNKKGVYYVGCDVTAIQTTGQIQYQSAAMNQLIRGDQFVYGTNTGAIGFVLQLTKPWASILKRIINSLEESQNFRSLFNWYAPRFIFRKEINKENTGVIDGEKILLLLQMSRADIMRILESVYLDGNDQEILGNSLTATALLGKLIQFHSAHQGFLSNARLADSVEN